MIELDTDESAPVPDNAAPETPSLGSILRIPLRCGGRNGRCAAPIAVSLDSFANPANLRVVLERAGWGLITHGLMRDNKPVPLIDPACPECYAAYTAAVAEAKVQQDLAAAAEAALADAAEDGASDTGDDSAAVPLPATGS